MDPVGDAPVAGDVSASTSEDEPVVIDVTDDATDPDGDLDPDSVTIARAPAHGRADVGSTITYTPASDFHGTDTFDYQICDSTDRCDRATVTVTVSEVNDPPVARRDVVTVASGGRAEIVVLANDTDVDGRSDLDDDSVSVVTGPTRGTATVEESSRTITYTASSGSSGTDGLTYRICDRGGLCDIAAVDIRIDPLTSPTPSTSNRTLAATGSDANALLAAAFVTLSAGSMMLAFARRRQMSSGSGDACGRRSGTPHTWP